MASGGISAQYGFLFQRKAFIYYAVNNAATNQTYTFEGKDDIDISTEDGIYFICSSSSQSDSIQVKSSTVDVSCFCKAICNWLLIDDATGNHILFLENELPFSIDDSTITTIIKYIGDGKNNKRSSIARKTYDKYKDNIENDPSPLSDKINTLLHSLKLIVLGMNDLDKRLEEVFFSNYCQDIKEYDLAKVKRLERFISYINLEIDKAIKAKMPYILLFPNFIKTIMQVKEEISDERYITSIPEIKKKVKDEATHIVTERTSREVRQLFLVDQSEQFVIDGIVHELIYKDFREVYVDQKELELINIEQDAYENYKTALFSLEEQDTHIPKKVYSETVKLAIEGNLLPDGSVYRKGCYIYLTGDNVEEDTQITWGQDND